MLLTPIKPYIYDTAQGTYGTQGTQGTQVCGVCITIIDTIIHHILNIHTYTHILIRRLYNRYTGYTGYGAIWPVSLLPTSRVRVALRTTGTDGFYSI
jgi:hypothetical protein